MLLVRSDQIGWSKALCNHAIGVYKYLSHLHRLVDNVRVDIYHLRNATLKM